MASPSLSLTNVADNSINMCATGSYDGVAKKIESFSVPVGFGGLIIGKKGQFKAQLAKEYGADVILSNDQHDVTKQNLSIACPAEHFDAVRKRIEERLAKINQQRVNTPISNAHWLRPELELGKLLPGFVLCMPNPKELFVHLYHAKSYAAYAHMQAEIDREYERGGVGAPGSADPSSVATTPPWLPYPISPGCICIAPSPLGHYYRAIIIETDTSHSTRMNEVNSVAAAGSVAQSAAAPVMGAPPGGGGGGVGGGGVLPPHDGKSGLASVYCLDVGQFLQLPVNQLYRIKAKFMQLPFQTMPVRWAHAKPCLGSPAMQEIASIEDLLLKKFFLKPNGQPRMFYFFFSRKNCCVPFCHIYLPRSSMEEIRMSLDSSMMPIGDGAAAAHPPPLATSSHQNHHQHQSDEFVDLLELLSKFSLYQLRKTVIPANPSSAFPASPASAASSSSCCFASNSVCISNYQSQPKNHNNHQHFYQQLNSHNNNHNNAVYFEPPNAEFYAPFIDFQTPPHSLSSNKNQNSQSCLAVQQFNHQHHHRNHHSYQHHNHHHPHNNNHHHHGYFNNGKQAQLQNGPNQLNMAAPHSNMHKFNSHNYHQHHHPHGNMRGGGIVASHHHHHPNNNSNNHNLLINHKMKNFGQRASPLSGGGGGPLVPHSSLASASVSNNTTTTPPNNSGNNNDNNSKSHPINKKKL